jgi:hypothetical protein
MPRPLPLSWEVASSLRQASYKNPFPFSCVSTTSPSSAIAVAAAGEVPPLFAPELPHTSNLLSSTNSTFHERTWPIFVSFLTRVRAEAGPPPLPHRSYLRPSNHCQSTCGKLNQTPVSLVYLLRPPFAAGELGSPPEGTDVKHKSL